MARITAKYVDKENRKHSWGCITGCGFIHQGNAAFDRALKHATICKALQLHNSNLWQGAIEASGQG